MSTPKTNMLIGTPTVRLNPEVIESDYQHHPSELVSGGVSRVLFKLWLQDWRLPVTGNKRQIHNKRSNQCHSTTLFRTYVYSIVVVSLSRFCHLRSLHICCVQVHTQDWDNRFEIYCLVDIWLFPRSTVHWNLGKFHDYMKRIRR